MSRTSRSSRRSKCDAFPKFKSHGLASCFNCESCCGLSIEINGSEKRMDQHTEAPPARTLGPDAGNELYLNAIVPRFAASE
jgi:hypothetical protein